MNSNGLVIGKVKNLELSPHKYVLVTIELTKEIQEIPTDSKITLTSNDFFGNKAVSIDLGNASTYFNHADTIRVIMTGEDLESVKHDPISRAIDSGIDMLSNKDKIDSILIEIRRLNNNLEEYLKENAE